MIKIHKDLDNIQYDTVFYKSEEERNQSFIKISEELNNESKFITIGKIIYNKNIVKYIEPDFFQFT
jgi:hypothetical protein